MHQFKEKSEQQRELVSAGLFFYPVLQAADVLAYRADEVPVGDDQRQHVELMRDIAERFNARFGEDPGRAGAPDPGGRRADHGPPGPDQPDVDDLGDEQGTVYILDDADVVRRRSAARSPTRAGRCAARRDKAGITNLIEILSVIRGVDPDGRSRREFDGQGYGDFKGAVAEAVVDYLAPVRERYAELRADEAALEAILAAGAEKARAIASRDACRCPRARWASARAAGRPTGAPSTLSGDESRRARPRPRRLRGALRPPDGGRPARGGRLAEVELGEIVIAYLEHLEEQRRARPRRGDRVPRPDRLAAGAQVAAAAPGGRGGRDRARARGGGRRAAGADARVPALPRRGGPPRGLFADGRRYLYRSAPLPPELRRVSLDAARPGLRARPAGGGDRRPAARSRRSRTPATSGPPSRSSAARLLRELLARRGRFDFDEAFADRGPADPGGDPVRPARDAQARRGDAGTSARPSADHDQREPAVARRPRRRDVELARADRRGAAVPVAGAGQHRRARRGLRRERGRGRPGARRARGARSPRAAASSCARSPGATRWRPTPSPRTRRDACWRNRRRRRSPRRRPRRWRSSPTCSRSRGPRSRGSAASPRSPRCDADRARADRGVGPLALRRGGLPDDAAVRAAVRPLGSRPAARPARFDPTPEDERELRERLLRAGEQRAS